MHKQSICVFQILEYFLVYQRGCLSNNLVFCYADKWMCQNIEISKAEKNFMSTTAAKTICDELQCSVPSVTTALARNPLREAQTLLDEHSSVISWFPLGSCLYSPPCIPKHLNSPTVHLLPLMKVEKNSIIQCLWMSFMNCQSGPGSLPSNKGRVSKYFMEEVVHLASIQEDDQGHVPGAFIRQKKGWDTAAVALCSLCFTWRAKRAAEVWICQLPVLVYICVLLESIPSDYPEPLEPAQELPWHHGDEFCHSYSSVSSPEQQHSLLPFAICSHGLGLHLTESFRWITE